MEQADAKHCPKSEAGEKHDRHSWRDEYGVYSCDGDILSADDVFALLGIRRVAIDGDVPMFDTMDVSHILPKAEAINLLFGEPRNSLKHLKLNTEDLFPVEFGPVEEMTGPSYSPNDPLFAVADCSVLNLTLREVDHVERAAFQLAQLAVGARISFIDMTEAQIVQVILRAQKIREANGIT